MNLQAVLFTAFLLAACSQQPGNAEDQPMPEAAQQSMPMEAPPAGAPTADTPGAADMQMSEAEHKQMTGDAAATMAMASGTIESVDTADGKITIAHGPIEALKWPAMTMAFKASPEQLASAKPGQKVEFEFESKGADNTITRIAPMK